MRQDGRHDRQARFLPLGAEGQGAIGRAAVAVVGCGALGSVAAEIVARAGVRRLVLVDRDVVETSNLHRTALFTEEDAARALPKAVAAAARLGAIAPDLELDPIVADLDGANALELLRGADVVLDGTDNFEARHVLNEACLELALPWVHAAVLGATAVAWPITPGGACFACLVPDAPAPGEVATCETAGVIGPAVHVAAAVQAAEALKIVSGRGEVAPGPWTLDCWTGRTARVRAARDPSCATCARGERRWLGRARTADAVACGRGGVQVRVDVAVDLDRLADRLSRAGAVVANRYLLRFRGEAEDLTVFRDGRVLVQGTRDVARARAVVARWIGG